MNVVAIAEHVQKVKRLDRAGLHAVGQRTIDTTRVLEVGRRTNRTNTATIGPEEPLGSTVNTLTTGKPQATHRRLRLKASRGLGVFSSL
jgi:hypothetical protein